MFRINGHKIRQFISSGFVWQHSLSASSILAVILLLPISSRAQTITCEQIILDQEARHSEFRSATFASEAPFAQPNLWEHLYIPDPADKKAYGYIVGKGPESRDPFYYEAARFLPQSPDSTVLELGPGMGRFFTLTGINQYYKNVLAIEQSPLSAQHLRSMGIEVLEQDVRQGFPLADRSVDFVHSSHMIEHLTSAELHSLLAEIDRVLKPGGVVVLSAPLMSAKFYDALTHVRPYNPNVLINYLARPYSDERTWPVISHDYEVKALVYRYTANQGLATSGDPMLTSTQAVPRWFIKQLRSGVRATQKLFGVQSVTRTAYTLILQKNTDR